MRLPIGLSGALLMLAFFSLLPGGAYGQSDEDKLYDLLKGSVRATDRAFTVFHWEPKNSEFADKFRPDTSEGLLSMVRESARSFVKEGGDYGFYVANDPSISRSFGRKNWRLVQIEIPSGWRYLDIRPDELGFRERLKAQFPWGPPPCLATVLASNNGTKLRRQNAESFREDCAGLKERLLRRLAISGIRYNWLFPQLPRGCRNRDSSAFIITDGAWLSAENIKSYTADSAGEDPDRKAIQEIVLNTKPHKMFESWGPVALWKDLPGEAPISRETRDWMRAHLLNCRFLADPASSPLSENADEETFTAQ